MLTDFTILDLETTGLDPFTGRITEVAARRYRNGKLCAALSVLLASDVAPEPEAVSLNGLTHDYLLQHGKPERAALSVVLELLGDSVLVAHNAAFELSWLHQASRRLFGRDFTQPFLCTKTLAVELRAGSGISYSLKQLTRDLGIEWTGAAHRAMPDVVATKALLDILLYDDINGHHATLLNCCGMGPKHYPQVGLPAHAKPIVQ